MAKIQYYVDANGSGGKVSFLENALLGIETVKRYKKDLTGEFDYLKNMDCEIILHPGFDDMIDGVIFRQKSFALIRDDREDNLLNSESRALEKMTEHLSLAKEIHDLWEKIYIGRMNFAEADRWTNELVNSILSGLNGNGTGHNYDRFFGSMTSVGSVNFIDDLTEGFNRRVFIKGRPGTGKSTLLRKLKSAAQASGFDTETYYCSFDPKSLDMVVIREIGVCVFDSTLPHEMFPSRAGDEIFDMYNIAVEKNTDEAFAPELQDISKRYNSEIRLARKMLSDACSFRIKYNAANKKYEPAENILNDIREFIS